jgi:hypothetical protein
VNPRLRLISTPDQTCKIVSRAIFQLEAQLKVRSVVPALSLRPEQNLIANFRIQVMSPTALKDEQTPGLTRFVQSCLVRNTLLTTPQIRIEFMAPASSI